MRCDSARELLSEYTEGSIQTALRIPLETHLGECDNCRSEADGLREVWRMLDSAPVMDAPADLRAVVWAKIDAQEQARSRRSVGFQPAWRAMFTRKAAGWGVAILAVVALASVTIPGKYSPASFFIGIWGGQHAAATVTAGVPRHDVRTGVNELAVPLQWTGDRPASISASVESGPASIRESGADSIKLDVQPGAVKSEIVVRIQWNDHGQTQLKRLTVQMP